MRKIPKPLSRKDEPVQFRFVMITEGFLDPETGATCFKVGDRTAIDVDSGSLILFHPTQDVLPRRIRITIRDLTPKDWEVMDARTGDPQVQMSFSFPDPEAEGVH